MLKINWQVITWLDVTKHEKWHKDHPGHDEQREQNAVFPRLEVKRKTVKIK